MQRSSVVMQTDFYSLLISDSALSALLLCLFCYCAHVSPGLRGVMTWGVAQFVYTVGAYLLDGTAPDLAQSGRLAATYWVSGVGGVLACGGMAGLAWAVMRFVRQRRLNRAGLVVIPLSIAASLAGWVFLGTVGAQGAAMSATEVGALCIMLWHLRELRHAPEYLPARLMMLGCAVLVVLYGGDLYDAMLGDYQPNPAWVDVDLSTWFLLNFCMLMLTSFRAAEFLRQAAKVDPLTGALNRRGFSSALQDLRTKLSVDTGLAVIALDVDHFKVINDDHGHTVGDSVLQRLSDTVQHCIRAGDLFARTGGEEFVVVMPNADAGSARQLAERIRVEVMRIEFSQAVPQIRLTISLGVSHSTDRSVSFSELMRRADEALYVAKRSGRNRVEG